MSSINKNTPASSSASMSANNNSIKEVSSVSASAFLENIYPGKGQRNLKRSLRQNPNISAFQRSHSLHSMYSQVFQTNPAYKKNESTRASKKQKVKEQKEGVITEPFQPESVLIFLSHLGVSTTTVHLKIGEVLKAKLEDEVEKIDLRRNKHAFDALSKLLIQAWEARDVPELRPVLITVIKKLAEKTPTQLLQRLSDREDDGSLKHSEILSQFGLPMKRLVWEADWERSNSFALSESNNSIGNSATKDKKSDSSYFADMILKHVQNYCNDEDLSRFAEVSFVGSISERRIPTQQRRTMNINSSTNSQTTNLLGKKDDRGISKKYFSASAKAIHKIKEIVGDRPNLLDAVFHILIHTHGKNNKLNYSGNKILGGKNYLSCIIVGDILMVYGQLPKQYEFLGILANILDDSVRSGIVTDDAIAQIQGCLRSIFTNASNTETKKKPDTSNKNSLSTTKNTNTASTLTSVPTKPKKYSSKEDKTYTSSLLQEVIHSAIEAMKETDAKLVFLNPVTDAIAPGYSKVISKPMCILTIAQKNNSRTYQSLQEFEKDVDLMFQNCIKYNVGPEGVWFRGEAKRQRDIFKKNTGILSQAKGFWKKEMLERKKSMEKEYEKKWLEEKRKIREENARLRKTKQTLGENKLAFNETKSKNQDLAITRLTANDITPIAPMKIKKKRKDASAPSSTKIQIGASHNNEHLEPPSIPALASMMLSDPFVVRLLLEKIFRTIRVQVLKEKSIFLPSCHSIIPSLFQILHIVQGSSQLCAIKGRKYTVPDVGYSKTVPSTSSGTITINIKQDKEENQQLLYYSTLRVFVPRFAELLLSLHIDERLSLTGDLYSVLSSGTASLSTLPETSPDHWKNTNSLPTIRSLVQYAFVHIFAGNSNGRNNEKLLASLSTQMPRFCIVLSALSNGDMRKDGPFWRSLVGGLLNWKRKLGVKVRDLVTEFWLEWFTIYGSGQNEGCLCDPIHEIFISLLNEWTSLGNLILPRDKILSLSTSAVEKAEPSGSGKDEAQMRPFVKAWVEDTDEFAPIKKQYMIMLKNLGGTYSDQWKKSIGIDEESVNHLKMDDN